MTKVDFVPSNYESKWVGVWEQSQIYRALDSSDKPKSYLLIEFPYPSGERLHVGHARSYSCLDAIARLRRMKGMNVLFPLGWDAFGLPAENYALKTGIHPTITTKKNIENSKAQAQSWGLSIDWSREINTTDPNYYKWTQWIFVQLYKKGLAYKKEIAVNWCPSCKINLADEEVIDGKCEREGTSVERRTQSQWLLKITEYADRLLSDLETVQYREDIKQQQINWIGRKEGAKVHFRIHGGGFEVGADVFTTRIDTLFGVTFIVVAPEVSQEWLSNGWKANKEVFVYVDKAVNTSEEERKKTEKQKTGVDTGLVAVNPANNKELPVFVADYVLKGVGTGIVMGVPAHDNRDLAFAKKHGLEVVPVVSCDSGEDCYEGEGALLNSGSYSGMSSVAVREKMVADGLGEKMVHYHLRDWIFSRQHYWGEPIPMVWCEKDGWQPVPVEQLPVALPQVEKYQPTDTGESPLAAMTDWVNTTCPVCGGFARRETDTMPNWAGSSWYFLRYIDPHCDSSIGLPEKLAYWLPVDWYNGGMEHTTLHLLYSRFWHKFLFDIGVVPTSEPYAKRTSHGVILGPDGKRMSKSKGNVINPDEVIAKYGADALRLYEMFIGPFDQMAAWSWESFEGVHRFLKRVWYLVLPGEGVRQELTESQEIQASFYAAAEKVAHDLEAMKFNTAVSSLMELVNYWSERKDEVGQDMVQVFLATLAPMAPFITEELYWYLNGQAVGMGSIHTTTWPVAPEGFMMKKQVQITVQVNGKLRGVLEFDAKTATDQKIVENQALGLENVRKYVGATIKRVVFVPGRVINFIVG